MIGYTSNFGFICRETRKYIKIGIYNLFPHFSKGEKALEKTGLGKFSSNFFYVAWILGYPPIIGIYKKGFQGLKSEMFYDIIYNNE